MSTTYEEFINNILETRGRFACGDEYHETHHILPRCCDGTDDKDNLIDLFAREHFEAHRLLALENPDNDKLVYAWWMMSHTNHANQRDYEITAEEYEEARVAASEKISKTNKGRFAGENNYFYGKHFIGQQHPMYGHKHSKESKEKMSMALKGKFLGEKNPNYGKICELSPNYGRTYSEDAKKKMSEAQRGHRVTNDTKEKIRKKAIGRFHSEETKRKMSENRKGINNANSKIVCQFCLSIEVIDVWPYIDQASQILNINRSAISMCCVGKRNMAGGFIWHYLYDQTRKDGTVIPGAITLGLITEEGALKMLEEQKGKTEE